MDPVLKVALSSGLFVRHDAISNSVEHKLRILTELAEAGCPVDATVFTHGSDWEDPRVKRVDSVFHALHFEEFVDAQLHFFEFGIAYPLFNATALLAGRAPLVGVYHNITPPHLVAAGQARRAVEEAFVQKHNLAWFDHVSCVSELNRTDLVDFGIPPERLSLLPLPVGVTVPNGRTPAPVEPGDPVELLFVGRFVRAKGVLDLLEAVRLLVVAGVHRFRLTLAGNVEQSSPEVVERLLEAERSAPTCEHVRVVATPSRPALAELYERADALVLPSYHEGYCVPIVEALSAGRQVIASDAGNIPNVLGGLGKIVPVGDVTALTDAVRDWVHRVLAHRATGDELLHPTDRGELSDREWRDRVSRYVERFSFPAYREGFLRLLHLAASRQPGGSPRWLVEAAGAAC